MDTCGRFGSYVVQVAAAVMLTATAALGAEPPYPPSPAIAGMELDWSTHVRAAPGSDNWPVTWADDDHQYAAWGDGGGFGGTNDEGRVSLGVARIEGPWDAPRGVNVWGGLAPENEATFIGKSYGILCVDGVLYMWVGQFEPRVDPFAEVRLASSRDHGATWELAPWSFTRADGVMTPTFCQFGRDYSGARDGYVYTYLIRCGPLADGDERPSAPTALAVQRPGAVDLARVPKDRILERSEYRFLAGLRGDGEPLWTAEATERVPAFEDPNGVGWTVSVSHSAGLGRYLLSTENTETHKGMCGFFDAPEPWGPWTTVAYYERWGEGHVPLTTFHWSFANKWLSGDGRSFSLLFTGVEENDSWNAVRGRFVLR